MPGAAGPAFARPRQYILGLLAALCALAGFLWAMGILESHAYLLGLLTLGFAISYFMPRRFQANATYAVAVVAFIVAGIQIARLREEMDGAIIFAAYVRCIALLVAISSFKTFRRNDLWFILAICGGLLLPACVNRPELPGFGAALLFLLLAAGALWRPRRSAVKAA